jgi:hypothetical protein
MTGTSSSCKYELSVIVPSIRVHLHEQLYNSIAQSCDKHSWELIICGPYEPPANILEKDNFTWIQDWGSPSRAAQIASLHSSGRLLYHTTDDVKFIAGAISRAIPLAGPSTIVCMKYSEWYEYEPIEMPEDYWVLRGLPCYKGPEFEQINQEWGCFCQFIVNTKLFQYYGGFDAENFEYLNHVCHDFLFRVQRDGVKTVESKEYICNARWLQAVQEDHGPVFYSQMYFDLPKFNAMWGTPNDRRVIDCSNWERAEAKWKRRFG